MRRRFLSVTDKVFKKFLLFITQAGSVSPCEKMDKPKLSTRSVTIATTLHDLDGGGNLFSVGIPLSLVQYCVPLSNVVAKERGEVFTCNTGEASFVFP